MKNTIEFYEDKWETEINYVIGKDYDQYKSKYVGAPKFSLIDYYICSLGKPVSSIVEVGCGSGRVLDYFREKYCIDKAWGFDLSATAIEYARSRHPSCRFHVLDIDNQKLPFQDNTIDLVILCDIVEHVRRCSKLIAEGLKVSQNLILKLPLEKNVSVFCATLLGLKTAYTKQHPDGHIHTFSEGVLESDP